MGRRLDDLQAHRLAPAIGTPALVVHDLLDDEVPWAEGERFARLLPESRLLTTLDLGHQGVLADARVLREPPPDVLVYALADSSVNLGIRCHVANDDFFQTKCELLERIKRAFDDGGISIPYPQQDMHLFVRGADGERVEVGKALAR